MPRIKTITEPILDPAYDFVNSFLTTNFTDLTEGGAVHKSSGVKANWNEMSDLLGLARPHHKPPIAVETLGLAVSHWRRTHRFKYEAELANRLSYAGPNNQLERFLLAMTGCARPLDLAVMQHWIWQVKRKIHGLSVVHHMMPVFVGKTGSGKSEALRKLLAPLGSMAESGIDFGIFADERMWSLFEQKYAFFFDEMSKARKTDVESLKNTISATEKTYRRMHSNILVQVTQNGTFIGASNNVVSSLIMDPTSARRYYQIDVLDRCDWDTINTISYTELWTSIDEDGPCPVVPYLSEIHATQNAVVRAKSNPELWMDERCEISPDGSMASDLYKSFRDWETINDPASRTSSKVFGQQLLGLANIKKWLNKRGTFYNLSVRVPPPKGQGDG